jgi:catechol 2,3-dioxygenase-like lactoylglutathione lyase family enzyme
MPIRRDRSPTPNRRAADAFSYYRRAVTSSKGNSKMKLGAFSISLAVKDLAASHAFYEKLGFERVMGDPTKTWLILRNGETTIGLFQGMFQRNMLTFNPGWNSQAKALEEFDDVRAIQKALKASGLTLASEADEAATGPGSLMLIDPDGNPILIDQHVP